MATSMQELNKPKIGDTIRANLLGYKNKGSVIYLACLSCGKARWVSKYRPTKRCLPCSGRRTIKIAQAAHLGVKRPEQSERQRGAKNHMWRGGRVGAGKRIHGSARYIYVLIPPGHPHSPMANKNGYAMEHRIKMAEHLGRLLHRWEQVHHINGNRQDNRIENLELWKHSQPSGVRQTDYHCVGCCCFDAGIKEVQ